MLKLFERFFGSHTNGYAYYDEPVVIPRCEAFTKEGERNVAKREAVKEQMRKEGKLLTDGYKPGNVRGPTVLDAWLKEREEAKAAK